MAQIAQLQVSLIARTEKLEQGLKKAQADVLGFARQVNSSAKNIANTLALIPGAFAAIGAASGIGRAVSAINEVNVRTEALRATFAAVTNSSNEATRAFADASGIAERLALDTLNSAQAFASLTAASRDTALEGQATRDIFLGISQASRVLGLNAEKTRGALLAIEQIISKGTVASEELRGQLSEHLPGAFQIAERAVGVTTAQFRKMLEQGQVFSKDFIPKFAAQLQREFGGGVERATQTAGAAWGRAGNDIRAIRGEFSLLTKVLANVSEGLTAAAASAFGVSRAARLAKADLQAAIPGVSQQASQQFFALEQQREALQRQLRQAQAGEQREIPSLTRGAARLLFPAAARREQESVRAARQAEIRDVQRQLEELGRTRQKFLETERDFQRQFEAEAPGGGVTPGTSPVFAGAIGRVKQQSEALRTELAALERQASFKVPGFDLAAEKAKVLEKSLTTITEELSKQPGLVANLPPEINKAVLQQTAQLEQVNAQIQARKDDAASAKKASREEASEAKKLAREEEQKLERGRDVVASLQIQARLQQDIVRVQGMGATARETAVKTLEFEAQLREQGLTLSAQQQAEARRAIAEEVRFAEELRQIEEDREEAKRRAEAVTETIRGLESQIVLTERLVAIQGQSAQQIAIQEGVLQTEAGLREQNVEITRALHQQITSLVTRQEELNAALDAERQRREDAQRFAGSRTETFTDLARELNQLQDILSIQGLSRRERERELIVIQAKSRLLGQATAEELAGIRQIAEQIADSERSLSRGSAFRDFAESIDDFWDGLEERGVRALEEVEGALVRFFKTGTFATEEQKQAFQELNDLARERAEAARELEDLTTGPKQFGREALAQQERIQGLREEVKLLDNRRKILDDNIQSQGIFNKLLNELLDELLSASVRSLLTAPIAGTFGGAQQGGFGALFTGGQGAGAGGGGFFGSLLSSLGGLFGSGGGVGIGTAPTSGGLIDAGAFHNGGLVTPRSGRRVLAPASAFLHAPGFQLGGILQRGGDNIPALLQSGERVLSRAETSRLARLELATSHLQGREPASAAPTTVNMVFPGVTNRQEAEGIRRSSSQIQNSIITAVERGRARTNVGSSVR